MPRLLSLVVTVLLSTCTSAAMASDALQRIPGNALGFVIVRDVAQCSAKCEQLMKPFDVTFPAPLTFAKLVTGLESGLDVSEDLVVAHLPGASRDASSIPMVLLPIEDYVDFAASIHADSSGEICRITLMGEDILAAQHGSYAMLMNVEDEQTMEQVLALGPRSIPALSPINAWIDDQDVALVLMTSGVEMLSQWNPESLRSARLAYDFTFQPSYASQLLASIAGPAPRDWINQSVELAAVGINVDDHDNVRVGEQIILKKTSKLAKLAPQSELESAAKLGLSDKPCVIAAGGPLAPGWGKKMAKYLRELEVAQAPQTGLEKVSTELWDQEEQAFRLLLENVRSCSFVMLPGEKGEPLVGNFFGVATVDNVEKYFSSLPEVVETWNELNKLSTGEIQPEIELAEREVAGNLTREIVLDVGAAMADPNVPIINWMIDAAIGGDGKLRTKFVQVDETTLVFGLATDEQIAELLELIQLDKTSMPQLAEMHTTLQLLEPSALWKMLIQPQGVLKWVKRVVNEYLVLLEHGGLKLPPMPNSPPLGVSINWQDRRLAFEIVMPADTWETLGKYYETVSSL